MNFSQKNFPLIFIIFTFIIGILFRFYNLPWGYPYFFHPDENNITSAIIQLSFQQLNPHFFAYGGLPIYLTFFISSLMSWGKNSFSEVTYTLRFISASLSLLLLPSIFYIGKKIYNQKIGFIAVVLASCSIGLIQFAHFGTFEMWLTFFTLWFFYFCYALWKKYSVQCTVMVAFVAGILISTKVSSIIFLPVPIGIFLLQKCSIKNKIVATFLYSLIVTVFYCITNPFLFLDTTSFLNSLSYESSVAVGTVHVFYTQLFLHTIPILFQLQHVFPFLLNPIVFFCFLISFFCLLRAIIKHRRSQDVFLLLFFCIVFFSQAFLFVKWTRYYVPTLPFIYLMIALAISKLKHTAQVIVMVSLLCISIIFSFAFVRMAYVTDSRITASDFIKKYASNQQVIMEPYDLGSIAFNPYFPQAEIINIYNLEQDTLTQAQLASLLPSVQFFISPSQRLLHTRITHPTDFPKGNQLYKNLLDGSLGYHPIYQTPCDFWCHIIYVGNPIAGSVEETASVFDHPFVTVFEK